MALIASSTSLAGTEAGPLPVKKGEIGYVEDPKREVEPTNTGESTLPPRHPTDRDTPDTTTTTFPSTPTAHNTPTSPSSPPTPRTSAAKTGALSLCNRIVFCGFHIGTFLMFWILFVLFGGTIVAWVFLSRRFNTTSSLFFHLAFGISVLAELILLERRVHRLRAERHKYLHANETLPTSNTPCVGAILLLGPWNRPPLPTYSAALAQSNVSTGDVEDHFIITPPPPAYGHAGGSTVLLSGPTRDSLRAQRPISEHSHISQRDDRPISYASKDEQWEEVRDAERARRLEERLDQLERTESCS